jgi:DNA repair protein RecO (recombination protein O)
MLLDVFSREHGRAGVVAKGAKRKRNSASLLLRPFQRLIISWRGELMTLNKVEADRPAHPLTGDRLMSGFYINELIIRLLHQHEAHADLFDIYDATLGDLSVRDNDQQVVIRIFEKQLLQSLGYAVILQHDIDTGAPIDNDREYYYQAERGPARSLPADNDFVKITGSTLNSLAEETLAGDTVLDESKKLMRYLLQKHLGKKPLASRALYASYIELEKKQLVRSA